MKEELYSYTSTELESRK